MSTRPIIDAGPALNFFSINKERLLISVLGRISAPETVKDEVMRKSRADQRFRAAAAVWRRLEPNWLQVLSDDVTPALASAVDRISGLPMADRKTKAKDLGEIMVVAHAAVAAEAGQTVTVLIDDGGAARLAVSEMNRLNRLRTQGRSVGSIILAGTPTILERAIRKGYLPDKGELRMLYTKLRSCDDGLLPIDETGLLSPGLWS